MKKDETGKTKNFIKKGIIFWVIIIGIFILMKVLINIFGDLNVENSQSGFLDQLSGIVFIFGVCGIPIILFFSIALKFAEKAIDKIGNNENQKQ
ncbi:MAG: hypothetical protein AB8H03_27460 [Saprospiraceae bacterium]